MPVPTAAPGGGRYAVASPGTWCPQACPSGCRSSCSWVYPVGLDWGQGVGYRVHCGPTQPDNSTDNTSHVSTTV
ncbi:MAG: hypothetical protein V7646_4885 [Pseudonocardia sp.]